jgi:cysteinyl-tRNA synthetase
MSKSKGNYYTFRDVCEKGFSAAGVRYFLLSVPFRKQLNFTFDALRGADKTVTSLRDFRARVTEARCEPGSDPQIATAVKTALDDFESGMDDDLNTSVALASLHDLTREINTALGRQSLRADDQNAVLAALERIDGVLNIIGESSAAILDDEIQNLIDQRQDARHRRDFKRADEIRDELLNRGIVLEDTKEGVRWKRK